MLDITSNNEDHRTLEFFTHAIVFSVKTAMSSLNVMSSNMTSSRETFQATKMVFIVRCRFNLVLLRDN